MMKLYKYLYYRLYSWNLRQWGKEDAPHWNALLGVSFMMFINLTTIGLLIELMGFNVLLNQKLPTIGIIVIMIIVLIFNYHRLVQNGKFKLIAKEFSKETTKRKRYTAVLLWLYVILSFALNFTILYFIKHGYVLNKSL